MLVETIGWIGSILFVLAYFLVSRGVLEGAGKTYNFINLSASLLYSVYAIKKELFPVLVVELIWGTIAIFALIKAHKNTART